MAVKVILNPYANRWGAKARLAEIEAALTAVSLSYNLTITDSPNQGIDVAYEAAQEGYDAIVAAGGDGTINEVINGVLRAAGTGPTVPFGILPIGTANDFSDLIGLPRDLEACARLFAAGKTKQIDAGQVNERFFINNCAMAMEPMVTIENIKMTRFSGTLRYVVALVKALIRLKAWGMKIEWDGGGYEGASYLLSICNGPRTGGFYMAPEAIFDDGLLDFVFAPEVPKWTVLAILVRLFNKTHVHHPAVTYGKTTRLSLTSQPGTPIHADGEVFTESETAVTCQIHSGKVTLLVP